MEPKPTGIEEKVIKSTFRFSLFASGLSGAKAWRRRPAVFCTSEMDANMEPKTECSAKICSLCIRVENIKYTSYSISNLIRFSINIYTASSKRNIGPWQCAGDETQAYLGHPQYHDPNLKQNGAYVPGSKVSLFLGNGHPTFTRESFKLGIQTLRNWVI